ncbi:hypothetical protein H2201_006221 [Coniosporium apollinis]|uniref:Glycosyltransferase 2-like domain-containing protein n=1 Tax=Coniosporium apollinis TaxID=61459 RepID=A0ABQ9NU89_9PEZI|nr:hypothetical protein H2201_006221 [Coniosporium apollinis]
MNIPAYIGPRVAGTTAEREPPALNQSLSSFSFSSRPTTPRKQIEEVGPGTSVPLDLELINTRLSRTATWQAELQSPAKDALERRGTLTQIISPVVAPIQEAAQNVAAAVRRSSLYDVYEKAKARRAHLQRKKWLQVLFEYAVYFVLLAFIYFVLVGRPLWNGAVWWLYWVVENRFIIEGGFAITLGLATIYAFSPLLIFFEKDPPMPAHPPGYDLGKNPVVANTALLIPCYKSAGLIGATLEAALKIFPPSNIFVIANGNSPTPLDNTEEVCRPYGVNHVWSPIGSKIVAQFVGCYAAKGFKYVLLIDDDCALPPNFPIVSDRLKGKVKCIGYTIKSVGPESSKGTLCQQAQDLEYKISGLQRALAGMIGSATFPHGAISLWDTQFLIKTFHEHPGFSVSEDWFFGHVARKLGCRIKMCTSVFVETETPSAVFFSSGGSRGGFGEMTIFKQRFMRWNFFFVNGMWYNMAYILGSWKLGWWELGAKLFVFQESSVVYLNESRAGLRLKVYETLLYLLTPFVLPISFIVRPLFCLYLLLATFGLYLINVTIFNEIHLRRKNERVGFVALYIYYMPYKIILTVVNVASCYWSLYKYARYFARRHPKVIEDEKAVEVVLRLEETAPRPGLDPDPALSPVSSSEIPADQPGRRMTVMAVNVRRSTAHSLEAEQRLNVGLPAAPPPGTEMARVESLRVEDAAVEAQDFAEVQKPARVFSRGGEGEGVELGVFREGLWRGGRRKTSAARSLV